MSSHRHFVYPHLCDWWKNEGLLPAPASLVLMWLPGKQDWGTGGDIVVVYICKCGFDVGVYELSSPLLSWCVSGPDPSLVSSWRIANMSECGAGKMGWVPWGSAPALKVFLAKVEPGSSFSIQTHLMGNLGFSNSQALLVWVPGAAAGYVLAQQGVMFIRAPGNCSVQLLVTYLFVCFVIWMIALWTSHCKQMVPVEKRELKNPWWVLCLLSRMYFPMKIKSMEM